MKIILSILMFWSFGLLIAQDSLEISQWKFVNQYGLTGYALGLFDNAISEVQAGSEVQINLVSYQHKRHEFALSSGMFFINRAPEKKGNPHMQYFYFPVNFNYKIYSKNKKTFWQFGLGKPLLMYEDSKFLEYDDFWLNYEDAIIKPYNMVRKKIHGIHTIRFGYQHSEHFSMHIGEMSYLYSTSSNRIKNLTRISLGIEFKL